MVAACIALFKTTFKETGYQITIRAPVRFWMVLNIIIILFSKEKKIF